MLPFIGNNYQYLVMAGMFAFVAVLLFVSIEDAITRRRKP